MKHNLDSTHVLWVFADHDDSGRNWSISDGVDIAWSKRNRDPYIALIALECSPFESNKIEIGNIATKRQLREAIITAASNEQ